MSPVEPLPLARLSRPCPPEDIPFATTADAPAPVGLLGQERAAEALALGLELGGRGYHLFAVGPPGTGKETLVRRLLAARAAAMPAPPDRCYVYNFAEPRRPRALAVPAGRARALRADLDGLIADLRSALPAAFAGDDYRMRRQALERELKARQATASAELQEAARGRGVTILRTEGGIVIAPLRDGEVVEPDRFQTFPEAERQAFTAAREQTERDLEVASRRVAEWTAEHRAAERELERETTTRVARAAVAVVRSRHRDLPDVLAHLDAVEADVVDNARALTAGPETGPEAVQRALLRGRMESPSLRRYGVNVLVEHDGAAGAPVVFESFPVHGHLIGRVEHVAELGTLVTDFSLIRAGALHRAAGGFLVLDARRVLTQPFAWDALKRALRAREIRVESPGQNLGLAPIALEPEPIPLDVKVVLLGDRQLYHLLAAADPELDELFRIEADFEDDLPRDAAAHAAYAVTVAALVGQEELRPLSRDAVARVIEAAARQAGDAERLSLHMRTVVDLLREADHGAGRAGRAEVEAADVEAALEARRRRGGRVRDRILAGIRRGALMVQTRGERVGQVNGLAVVRLGRHPGFGYPVRISAQVRVGTGQVVDIEREVELGGPLHSKGVLILHGFLGARFGARHPLCLAASLVFEQSYGGVDGDSASLAEACALLSARAELPVRQRLAMTGSVDQHGRAQPIGGVDDKVEGFFDAWRETDGEPGAGVIIPAASAGNLMLRRDVVVAAAEGRFHVYAVASVDEAIELLTGRPAGVRGDDGRYPEGSVNRAVEDRLAAFAEAQRSFGGGGGRPA